MTQTSTEKSTVVRYPFKIRAIRTAFAGLEVAAPWPASRWALDLWCTLPGNRGRRRDDRPGAGTRSTVPLDGRDLAVESWGAGPVVYLVHGWGGWRGQLGRFVEPLTDAGFRVVGFDAPSHGDSEAGVMGAGKGNGLEFGRALAAVAEVHGPAAAVVAHSFGCATSTVAISDGLRVGKLIFVGPSVDPTSYLGAVGDIFGFRTRIRDFLFQRIERLAGRPLSDFDPSTLAARTGDPLPPTLIVHDRRDKEVPYAEGERLDAAWPNATLITTDGLGHQRILRDDDVIKQAVAFLSG